jgi:gas vesicle protein
MFRRRVRFWRSNAEGAGCGTIGFWKLSRFSGSTKGEIRMAEDSRINGFAWFVAGLGLGALAGILFAPKSGRETREELANSAREGTEYLRTRGKQVAEQVGGIVDKGREQVGEYVDRGRDVVDRGRAQWEEFVERGKSLVGDQTTRVAAAVDAGRQAYRSTTAPTGTGITGGSTTGSSTTGGPYGSSSTPSTSSSGA